MLQRLSKTNPKSPDSFDVEVGRKIRTARLDKGMSQIQLGVDLGITFQQIQKYEKGMNKCPTSRLITIAELTGRTLPWFLPASANGKPKPPTAAEILGTTRDGLRLAKAFNRIQVREQRLALVHLVETNMRGQMPPSQRLHMVREIVRAR